MSPYILLAKIGGVLALMMGIGAGYVYWHHEVYASGFNTANEAWIKKEADIKAQADAALQQKNEEVRLKDATIVQQTQQIEAKSKESDDAKTNFDNLRAQYAANIKRLSVRSAASAPNPAQQSDNSAAAPGIDQNVQLMPDFSTAIIDLARGYSENLRMKNECIDLYNEVRTQVNEE
jgi:hypothetical protein